MGVKGLVCRTRVRKESMLGNWVLCFSRSKDGGGGGGGATRRKSVTRRAETDGQSEAKPGACDEKRRSEVIISCFGFFLVRV
ncbi:hypothetical protein BCR33DRAFT_713994 [Rhizoclosmatium globosum]|uniref:Uncharacterized protein n=1 Tax=Rhizoclosmatium globosum TaxID=329046 RepID=A0A1Y2CPC0_9FUNG|nr:hypothetical protein BCR33DRAFT_713994 [Rhizoclosmatium globosum]|eukprot:ORY48880.1 hypothetical protein BCR33DRAFT_713994 [Rhizoclosmatium globosum]